MPATGQGAGGPKGIRGQASEGGGRTLSTSLDRARLLWDMDRHTPSRKLSSVTRPVENRASRAALVASSLVLTSIASCSHASPPAPASSTPAFIPSGPGPLAAPFITDLAEPQAAAWLRAMEGETAVVAFVPEGLRLLEGCTAAGVYGARSLARKPALARFGGLEEIRFNLPGSTRWLEDDDVLDDPMTLAFLVTGELLSMRSRVPRQELHGSCEGATHFVHRLEVGVHARAFGPVEDHASPEEVFREARVGDDLLPVCARGGGAVAGVVEDRRCAQPVRLHLVAIGEDAPDPALVHAVQRNPCPPSTFLHGEVCAPPRGE